MKTVIEMAEEAGFERLFKDGGDWVCFTEEIERFAELVRAEEREQIAQMIEDAPPLVEFVQNNYGGCSICGFTPKVAAATIRAKNPK